MNVLFLNPSTWFKLVFLSFAITIAACGGGGGSEDEDEDTIGILPQYHFKIGGMLTGNAGPSIINIEQDGSFSLSSQPNLQGTLSCDPITEECALETVNVGSSILVDDEEQVDPFVDDINIEVDTMWLYNPLGSDRPAQGGVRIDPLADGAADIYVRIVDCDMQADGTEIQVTIDQTISCHSWNEFESWIDDPETRTLQQRQASFGWGAVEFTLEQIEYSLLVFPLVDEDYLTNPDTSYYEPCDSWGAWPVGSPPVNPGSLFLDWSDDFANGEPGPGDSFRLEFNHCWIDEEGDNIDTLLNGIIDLVGYTEMVENDIITRIGFEAPAVGSGKTGGVAYGYGDNFENPLVITETIEENGDITTHTPITLSGRYYIVFAESL